MITLYIRCEVCIVVTRLIYRHTSDPIIIPVIVWNSGAINRTSNDTRLIGLDIFSLIVADPMLSPILFKQVQISSAPHGDIALIITSSFGTITNVVTNYKSCCLIF